MYSHQSEVIDKCPEAPQMLKLVKSQTQEIKMCSIETTINALCYCINILLLEGRIRQDALLSLSLVEIGYVLP